MTRKIHIEPINKRAEYKVAGFLTREEVAATTNRMADRARYNMEYFGTRFPSSATRNRTYRVIDNIEWADGFWTGLLQLCYEHTEDDAFKNLALKNVDLFLNRVEKRIELDRHDLGFLYSLSCVAGYKLIGSAEGRRTGLLAADKLMERFQKKGGLIQAWRELGARDNYRLITDCLLNIPLLHWAFLETGNPVYQNAVVQHYGTVCSNVIRGDASAYHTFYFGPETGEPLRGVTRQGYSGDLAWARGQVWGIYDIPLNYRYIKDGSVFSLFKGMTNYFLDRLPEDEVCYWDLMFADDPNQSRDSSTAAIGVRGIHEMPGYLPEIESDKNTYRHAVHCILCFLMERHTAPEVKPGNPVLLHGMYP